VSVQSSPLLSLFGKTFKLKKILPHFIPAFSRAPFLLIHSQGQSYQEEGVTREIKSFMMSMHSKPNALSSSGISMSDRLARWKEEKSRREGEKGKGTTTRHSLH
jgi:hypothetical protein